MPLAEWVSKRNNTIVDSSNSAPPSRCLTVQEAQALKFQSHGIFSTGPTFESSQFVDKSDEQPQNQLQANVFGGPFVGLGANSDGSELAADIENQHEYVDRENEDAPLDPINAFMQSNLAAMTQEQRNAAGLGHLPVPGLLTRFTSNNSYPSTTSGRVEEIDEELDARTIRSQSTIMLPSHRCTFGPDAAFRRDRPLNTQLHHHAAQHKQDLHLAYQLAHKARSPSSSNTAAGTKRKSPNVSHDYIEEAPKIASSQQHRFPATPSAHIPVRGLGVQTNLEPRNQRQRPNGIELEYDLETLHKMDFSKLLQQPFDEQNQGDTMIDQLETAFKSPIEEQRSFFNSLALNQWEEAGAWFTERFKELTEKLYQSRQDRRKLAIQFEQEICRRHEAVVAEGKTIDNQLEEMSRKGALVLSSPTERVT